MKKKRFVICLLAFATMFFIGISHVAAALIEGVYKTNFNEMTLELNENHVTGTYKFKGGKIDGILEGNRLTGSWEQTNAKGQLEFIFSEDFSSFTGKWGYNGAVPTKKWNGKKSGMSSSKPGPLAPPPMVSQPNPPVEKKEPAQQPEPVVHTDSVEKTVPVETVASSKSENPAPVQNGSDFLLPGQSAMYKDLEVSLLSLTKTSDYINGPKAGHFYAVLRYRVFNTGKQEESAHVLTSDIQWKDPSTGMREGWRRTTGVKLNNPENWDLPVAAQGEFEEVYMFPDHLSQVEFHLLKGYNPKELARWLIPIQ